MTRAEYNDYRYIKSYKTKGFALGFGTQLTIPTEASVDYKIRLHKLYSEWNFHPASVRVDPHWFDDKERIVYIFGREWKDDDGNYRSWTELYTLEERERFDKALHS